MKLVKRMSYFVVGLLLSLILVNSASAFTWQPNFYNYVNFTSFNSIATYNGIEIGQVNYVNLNLSNVYNGNIPIRNYLGYVWLEGFNSTGAFVGNIPAYPYSNGLLVPIKTTNGYVYNTITLFFNQSVSNNTYYYSFYNKVYAGLKITDSFSTQTNNYVSYFDDYPYYQFYAYLTPSFNLSTSCIFLGYSIANSTCYYSFNPNIPYYFYETKSYPKQNVSVDYIIDTGLREFNIYGTNSLTIVSKGIIGSENLTQSSNTPYSAIINSTNYYLMSDNVNAIKSSPLNSVNISNSSKSELAYLAVPFKNNLATIGIYNTNLGYNTSFVLVPAYTNSYTTGNIVYNATPKTPIISCTASNQSGWYCMKYREQIKNINWSYNFTTLAYPSHLGTSYKIIEGNGATPYFELNMTPYSEMGINCNNVYMDAWDNVTNIDYGAINFSVLNCSSNRAIFLLPNKTRTGALYSEFFVYWYSLINQTLGSTNYVKNNFIVANGNYSVILNTSVIPPYLINLKEPLYAHGNSIIIQGSEKLAVNYNGDYRDYAQAYGINPVNDITRNTNLKVLVTNSLSYTPAYYNFFTTTLSMINVVGYTTSNTTNSFSIGGFLGAPVSTLTISLFGGNEANVTKLFTSQHLLNPVIQQNPLIAIINNSNPRPSTPIILPNSNTSIIPSLSNLSEIGDQSGFIAKYSYNVNFFSLIIPEYYIMMIAILEVFVICLLIASGNEFLVIIGIIGLWATGIFTAISGNLSLVIIAIIISIIYVVMNAKKWFK